MTASVICWSSGFGIVIVEGSFEERNSTEQHSTPQKETPNLPEPGIECSECISALAGLSAGKRYTLKNKHANRHDGYADNLEANTQSKQGE